MEPDANADAETSHDENRSQRAQTYKEVVQKFPLQKKAVEGLKKLCFTMCPSCSDMLHYELVRTEVIPNNLSWVPRHQRPQTAKGARKESVNQPRPPSSVSVLNRLGKPKVVQLSSKIDSISEVHSEVNKKKG